MTRRGRNEGSIRNRPDGTWEGRISIGGRRHSVYGASKGEVLNKIARVRFEGGFGYPDGERLTVAEYLDRWLVDTVDRTCRPRTRASYRDAVRRHIVPFVGAMKMADLRPTSMDGLISAHERAKVPAASARYACVVFKLAVRSAARKEVIKSNPFADVRLVRPMRKIRPTWTAEQANQFFDAAEKRKDRLWAFYVMAVATGLRHGELLALQWGDIDFQNAVINVRHTLLEERNDGRTIFSLQPVKTRASEAVVGLPAQAIRALRKHQEARLAEGLRTEFVFTTKNGTHYSKTTVRNAYVASMKRTDLPYIRIHDLRHTCATLLFAAGADVKEVQAQVRHGDATTTMNTYVHLTKEKFEGTAKRMDGVLAAAKKESK